MGGGGGGERKSYNGSHGVKNSRKCSNFHYTGPMFDLKKIVQAIALPKISSQYNKV